MQTPEDAHHPADPPPRAADGAGRLVDWAAIGRRLRRSAVILLGLALAAWLLVGVATGGPELGDAGGYLGAAVAGMFLVEVVVVGGSAVRGMLRAGEQGERLAGGDVSLLPPQLRRD